MHRLLILYLFQALFFVFDAKPQQTATEQHTDEKIVRDLFRLRNAHNADSAELFFADTVQVYMKYLRNVPRGTITRSDKLFWQKHPGNKFEITGPIKINKAAGLTIATIYGKEYLNGTTFLYERIEIKFNSYKKIFYYRGFNWNGGLQ